MTNNILIIGYGDLGNRLVSNFNSKNNYKFYGASRSLKNTEEMISIQWNWLKSKKLELGESDFSHVVFIPKPSSMTEEGYKDGFDKSIRNVLISLEDISFGSFIAVSSTRVFGQEQKGVLTENIKPIPDNYRGEIILKYEKLLGKKINRNLNILRFAGLYDLLEKKPNFKNKISRNNAALIIEHFIHNSITGTFNCLEDSEHNHGERNISNEKLKSSGFNFI